MRSNHTSVHGERVCGLKVPLAKGKELTNVNTTAESGLLMRERRPEEEESQLCRKGLNSGLLAIK